jgi:hypothetical protein
MFGIKSAIGITALGLVSLATPAAAGGWANPGSASTGNLTQPSYDRCERVLRAIGRYQIQTVTGR